MLAALSRCRPASRWTLSQRCPALSLSRSTVSSQRTAATRLHVLRTQTALFHQSEAKAGPDPHKATSVSSSGSGLEGELFGMGMWSLGLGAISAALAGLFLANTDLCLPKAGSASLEYLAETDLRSSTDENVVIKANSLWETNGAVIMVVRRPG